MGFTVEPKCSACGVRYRGKRVLQRMSDRSSAKAKAGYATDADADSDARQWEGAVRATVYAVRAVRSLRRLARRRGAGEHEGMPSSPSLLDRLADARSDDGESTSPPPSSLSSDDGDGGRRYASPTSTRPLPSPVGAEEEASRSDLEDPSRKCGDDDDDKFWNGGSSRSDGRPHLRRRQRDRSRLSSSSRSARRVRNRGSPASSRTPSAKATRTETDESPSPLSSPIRLHHRCRRPGQRRGCGKQRGKRDDEDRRLRSLCRRRKWGRPSDLGRRDRRPPVDGEEEEGPGDESRCLGGRGPSSEKGGHCSDDVTIRGRGAKREKSSNIFWSSSSSLSLTESSRPPSRPAVVVHQRLSVGRRRWGQKQGRGCWSVDWKDEGGDNGEREFTCSDHVDKRRHRWSTRPSSDEGSSDCEYVPMPKSPSLTSLPNGHTRSDTGRGVMPKVPTPAMSKLRGGGLL